MFHVNDLTYSGAQSLQLNRRECFTLELDTEIQMPQSCSHGNLSVFSREDQSLKDLLVKLQQLLEGWSIVFHSSPRLRFVH